MLGHRQLARDQFTVVGKVAIECLHLHLVYDVEAIAEGAEEVLVVTHHHQATFEVVQRDNKSIYCVEIEMVSGLIEQQDVGLLPSDNGEGDAGLLTTGEEVHRSEGHVAADTEATEVSPELVRVHVCVLLHHLLHCGESQIERVHVMLGENSHTEPVVQEAVAVLQLKLSDKSLDQGGLASTVRSDQGDSRIEVNVDVDFSEDGIALGPANVGFVETTEGW